LVFRPAGRPWLGHSISPRYYDLIGSQFTANPTIGDQYCRTASQAARMQKADKPRVWREIDSLMIGTR